MTSTRISLVFSSFLLVACGGAPRTGAQAPASAPPSAAPNPMGAGESTVSAPVPTTSNATSSDKEAAKSSTVDDVAHAQVQFDDSQKSFGAAGGNCVSMCKALSSMRRAADHLCALTKEGGDGQKKRCDDAQAKVDGAKERVAATCGGCG